VTWIMQGKLAETPATGYLVEGVAEFGNQGCTTKMLFKRVTGS